MFYHDWQKLIRKILYVHSNSLIFLSLLPCQIHYSINFYSYKIWHYNLKDATRAKKTNA